jgi:outer membrane lipoprotein-sorting protein
MNIFRRLALSRLLLLCGLVIALGASATAIAFALDSGPTPPPKPLAQAIHDALDSSPVEGLSAQVQLTDHLLEGADLSSGGEAGQLASNPLISGASGRLWISKEGDVRLELQSEKGDTEIFYDGQTATMYDASSNTLYRYVPPSREASGGGEANGEGQGNSEEAQPQADRNMPDHQIVPGVAKIEEAISHLSEHGNLSGARPTDVAGQAAYEVRVSPRETGSLLGGAALSFDAVHGMPLRAALYSTESATPVIELAATSISYGPVEPSVFEFTPPASAKVEEILPPKRGEHGDSTHSGEHQKLTGHGHGLSTIGVLESQIKPGDESSKGSPEGLPEVNINGTKAIELSTELGTLLTFERSGVRYLLAGALTPSTVEALAKGL